jgi:formylglycine-generating enzyme required for sulfatase activity
VALQLTGGQAHISLTSDPGSPCQVQFATNLAAGTRWFALSNFTLRNNPTIVLDPVGLTNGPRFYRAMIAGVSNVAWVTPGTFIMGSPTNELQRGTDEVQHSVTLSKGFYVSQTLVTQGQYLSLMNTNPSYFTPSNGFSLDLNRPVEQVSWVDATNYCNLLTQQEKAAGRIFTNWAYRLPTESEWEFACRAGTTNAFYYGPDLHSGMANFFGQYEYVSGTGTVLNPSGQYLGRTSTVASYQPNAVGLYDMAGNLREWCQDWYGNYPTNAVTDPPGATNGTVRVYRGGAFNDEAKDCRSARRDSEAPSARFNTIGFRVVLSGP